MPYEAKSDSTMDFVDQLPIIENLIINNTDCHAIVGGGFNVDFKRNSILISALKDFCTHISLSPTLQHKHCSRPIDFTSRSNTGCYSTLDHFLLTSGLFDTSVKNAYVMRDADNLSDHDPVVLHLSVSSNKVNLSNRHWQGSLRKTFRSIELF